MANKLMIEKTGDCKVGDLVKVDCSTDYETYKWTGVCIWTDEYKYSFALVSSEGEQLENLWDGYAITWTINDLHIAEAEVISESR